MTEKNMIEGALEWTNTCTDAGFKLTVMDVVQCMSDYNMIWKLVSSG